MHGSRGLRSVASATALFVALSACVVVLSGSPAAAAHKRVRVTVAATAHATARFSSHARARSHARATVRAVSRPARKGKPVGRARATVRAHARASGYATSEARARATAHATVRAATKKKALARAHRRAHKRAHRKAHARAETRATRKARHKAHARARANAHHRAVVRAHAVARHRARHRARLRRIDPHDPTTWLRYAPRHVRPHAGATFNNPYAGLDKQRADLAQVIHSIKSSPGYRLIRIPKTHRRLHCPSNPRYAPSKIRIAVYSIADARFADAIVAAQRRCVSVQVLMNSHLTSVTSHSWGRIARALGPRSRRHWRHQRSFAHRCSNGCLGTSVLHDKFFLFSRAASAHDTVVTGSSNMTTNAVDIQWNDLYTVNGNHRLYRVFRAMFHRMVNDRPARGPYVYRVGRYTATFYPFRKATRSTDRTMKSLRTISCRGARGGTGIRGRTTLYIAMHAWFSHRGLYLAHKIRQLYHRGCYVRILYSFMSHPVYRILRNGTGHRMVVRRVLYAGPLGLASKYSHMKMLAVSGHVGHDHSSRVVWTGSNNWVDKSLHADEVTLRIRSARAYRSYVRHWKAMRNRRSSPYYASFHEPEGGGRAP